MSNGLNIKVKIWFVFMYKIRTLFAENIGKVKVANGHIKKIAL